MLACAVAFIEAILFSALAPLVPYFKDELGLSEAGAGIVVAAYAVGAFAGAFPSISVTRRVGPKHAIVAAFGLLAVSTLVLGTADTFPVVVVARFAQGIGSALAFTGALAWLTGVTEPELRAEAIGIAFSAAFTGALLGPLLGAAAAQAGITLVFALVAALVALLGIATLRLASPAALEPGGMGTPPLATLFHDRRAGIAIWLIAVAGLLLGVVGVLVPLRLDELGWGSAAIGGLFAVVAVTQAAFSPMLGRLADQRGRETMLRLWLVCAGAAFLGLVLDERSLLYAGIGGVAIFALGAMWTPATALLADAVDGRGFDQATAAGLMNVAWAPGFAVGGIVAGAIAATVGDTVAYLLTGALCLATLPLLRAGS